MPVLPPEYWPWRDAFLVLHRSRQHDMGAPEPIMLKEMAAYWNWIQPDDDAAMFISLMQSTDEAYLKAMSTQTDKEIKQTGQELHNGG